jgi:demethylmenaquinone methyltransferase / 2-methoxy-6-polyprenyl-1,4-benzoquinol methylase
MIERSGPETVRQFFTGTSLSYDHISNLCTFGADRWWKLRILDKIPAGSTCIMDQACGTGILSIKIARRFPHARVIGVDMTEEYLDVARKKAETRGVRNVQFLLGRAEDVDPGQPVDCITSSYLAKYADLELLVHGSRRMLKDGGTLIMHDFTYPRNRAFSILWEFYFTLLRTIGARVYPEWRAAFDGLPALLKQTVWVEQLQKLLQGSGFSDMTMESLTIGTSAIVTARSTGPSADWSPSRSGAYHLMIR